jgi:hypothetical protein
MNIGRVIATVNAFPSLIATEILRKNLRAIANTASNSPVCVGDSLRNSTRQPDSTSVDKMLTDQNQYMLCNGDLELLTYSGRDTSRGEVSHCGNGINL